MLTVLVKGPNIASLPDFEPLGESISGPVLLKLGDNVSTDEILPAGAKALAVPQQHSRRSVEFAFAPIDDTYHDRALEQRDRGGHFIVGRRQLRPRLEQRARSDRARATSDCTR